MHLSTFFLLNISKNKVVDVDPDTKSEPDSDDSNDINEEHDGANQQDVNLDVGLSPSMSSKFHMTLYL